MIVFYCIFCTYYLTLRKMCVFYEISKKSVSFAGAAHKQIVSYYQQSKYNAHAPEHTFYE